MGAPVKGENSLKPLFHWVLAHKIMLYRSCGVVVEITDGIVNYRDPLMETLG